MEKPKFGEEALQAEKERHEELFQKFNVESIEEEAQSKPLYTGRYIVTLTDENQNTKNAQKLFESKLGFKVACSNDFKKEVITESKIKDADVLIYDELGIALVCGKREHVQVLETVKNDVIIEPEKIVYVPEDIEELTAKSPSTWGLKATRVIDSNYTGSKIKIAVLDTGFDLQHPDFTGRDIHSASFVPNEAVQDRHGHGTHCIGTACGNTDNLGVRYGVGKETIIYAGKVLSNQGSGAQSWILNAIAWAINNGCKVISMSLGSAVFPGESYNKAYERAAQYALSKGCIMVAAAGNESERSQQIFAPVGSPANCPSVLAVAALDADLQVGDFSNRAINPTGTVDVAAPGVQIYSSWPMPTRYKTISGTSMATPHVAGILALLWEKYPTATPQVIISELNKMVKKLPLQSIDIGNGLSIAP